MVRIRNARADQKLNNPTLNLNADQALSPDEEDRLGVSTLAGQLGRVLSDPSLSAGFVLGLEGPWGSGKSTLANRTIKAIKADLSAPKVIAFNPWLVGTREGLIGELFNELDLAVQKMTPNADAAFGDLKNKTLDALRRYAGHLGLLAHMTRIASTATGAAPPEIGVPTAVAAEIVGAVAEASQADRRSASLIDQRRDLRVALQNLNRRIVIVIDDLDRLEPSEALEVARLVKAVGDLPNLIYVLCYDRTVLCRNLEIALGAEVGKGAEYLEKIVQASVGVPAPEEMALRRWFGDEVEHISGLSRKNAGNADALQRLREVVDVEGGSLLRTPRDVIRAINSIKLVWPAIREHVDFADLVWLHLLRLKNPELHNWVERYLNEFAVVATSSVYVRDGQPMAEELGKLLGVDLSALDIKLYSFKRRIPGMSVGSGFGGSDTRKWSLYNLDSSDLDSLTRDKRLGSPHYFRYYFSLGQHGALLPTEVLGRAIAATTSAKAFASVMRELIGRNFADGTLHLAPMLDVVDAHLERIGDTGLNSVVAALSDQMDRVIEREPPGFGGPGRSWSASKTIALHAMRRMSIPARAAALHTMMSSGRALTWVADMLRLIMHDNSDPLRLAPEIVAEAGSLLTQRFNALGLDLIRQPRPGLLLRAWRDIADDETVQAAAEKLTINDQHFVVLVHSFRSWASSSAINRPMRPLQKTDVEPFLDWETTKLRISDLARRAGEFSPAIRAMIEEITAAVEDGNLLRRS